MKRFIALHPTEEAAELLKRHPNAFLLLTQIAMRARWDDCRITGLKAGQSFIGDWKNAGLHSIMAYKVAKQTLEKIGIATFKGTNKGTIATLVDSKIFSVTSEANNQQDNHQTTIQQPSNNHQTTTNHSEHKEHSDTDFLLQPETEPPPPPKATRARHVSQDAIRWTRETKWSGITEQDRSDWKAAFPACDLDRQLALMDAWLAANPAKAKKSNWRKFITTWLTRSQDRGGDIASNKPRANGCL